MSAPHSGAYQASPDTLMPHLAWTLIKKIKCPGKGTKFSLPRSHTKYRPWCQNLRTPGDILSYLIFLIWWLTFRLGVMRPRSNSITQTQFKSEKENFKWQHWPEVYLSWCIATLHSNGQYSPSSGRVQCSVQCICLTAADNHWTGQNDIIVTNLDTGNGTYIVTGIIEQMETEQSWRTAAESDLETEEIY